MKKTLKFALAAAALCVAVNASAAVEVPENGPGDVVNVPEPVSLALLGSGLVGMGLAAARRRKASKN